MSNLIIDKARICGNLKSLMDALKGGMERIDHEAGDHVALNVIASAINEALKKSSQSLGNLIEVIEVKAKETEAQAVADGKAAAEAEIAARVARERAIAANAEAAEAEAHAGSLAAQVGAVDESHPMHSKERQAMFRELSGFQRQPWHSDGAFMAPDGVIHEVK